MALHGSATSEGTKRYMENALTKGAHPMHMRTFLGLWLTSMGMGTYLGEADEETDNLVLRAVKESVERGAVNVVDTAINYRFQKAERAVGRALRELSEEGKVKRDEFFVSTKNGYLTHDADAKIDFWKYVHMNLVRPGIIKAEDISSEMHCMEISFLEDQLKKSLRNLDMDCLDLIYLHNAAESQLHETAREEFMSRLREVFEFYEEARKAGVIKFYGLATWTSLRTTPESPEYLSLLDIFKMAKEIGGEFHGFRFIQLPYNMAMQEASYLGSQRLNGETMSVLAAAEKLGIGVFTSVPLLQGRLLTSQLPNIEGMSSRAQIAIQFARSAHGAIIAPLVGHKNPRNVKENLRLASLPPLSKEEFLAAFGDWLHLPETPRFSP